MQNTSATDLTILGRLNRFLDRYRSKALTFLAVLVVLALIASKVFPSFGAFLTSNNVVPYLTLLLVIDLSLLLYSQNNAVGDGVDRFRDQDESLPALIAAVSSCRKSRIDLIEYAGGSALPLIREIQRRRIPVRILVKHPDTVSGVQRLRMTSTLDTFYNSIFAQSDDFEIRCYRLPYSVRARRFGNSFLELGWLTPDPKRQTAYGHGNPSIMVDLKVVENQTFEEFFDRSFDTLWEAQDTEDGRAVLDRTQVIN